MSWRISIERFGHWLLLSEEVGLGSRPLLFDDQASAEEKAKEVVAADDKATAWKVIPPTLHRVFVNKYSHEGSGFGRVLSEHPTYLAAVVAADEAHATGHHRFVYVENVENRQVYNPALRQVRYLAHDTLIGGRGFWTVGRTLKEAKDALRKRHVNGGSRLPAGAMPAHYDVVRIEWSQEAAPPEGWDNCEPRMRDDGGAVLFVEGATSDVVESVGKVV